MGYKEFIGLGLKLLLEIPKFPVLFMKNPALVTNMILLYDKIQDQYHWYGSIVWMDTN